MKEFPRDTALDVTILTLVFVYLVHGGKERKRGISLKSLNIKQAD